MISVCWSCIAVWLVINFFIIGSIGRSSWKRAMRSDISEDRDESVLDVREAAGGDGRLCTGCPGGSGGCGSELVGGVPNRMFGTIE